MVIIVFYIKNEPMIKNCWRMWYFFCAKQCCLFLFKWNILLCVTFDVTSTYLDRKLSERARIECEKTEEISRRLFIIFYLREFWMTRLCNGFKWFGKNVCVLQVRSINQTWTKSTNRSRNLARRKARVSVMVTSCQAE